MISVSLIPNFSFTTTTSPLATNFPFTRSQEAHLLVIVRELNPVLTEEDPDDHSRSNGALPSPSKEYPE